MSVMIAKDPVEEALAAYHDQTESLILEYLARVESRIRTLEQKQNATILHKDALILASRIRARAAAEAEKYHLDRKAEGQLRTAVKLAVLQRYGIPDLHDLPAAKLDEAAGYIDILPVYRTVLKIREKQT